MQGTLLAQPINHRRGSSRDVYSVGGASGTAKIDVEHLFIMTSFAPSWGPFLRHCIVHRLTCGPTMTLDDIVHCGLRFHLLAAPFVAMLIIQLHILALGLIGVVSGIRTRGDGCFDRQPGRYRRRLATSQRRALTAWGRGTAGGGGQGGGRGEGRGGRGGIKALYLPSENRSNNLSLCHTAGGYVNTCGEID